MNIEAKELSKIYGNGENSVVALNKVSLEIASSDFISIMGPSGSGKSTLLHLLSGLDKPTSGKSGGEVMEMLQSIWKKMGKTLVVITHDKRIARMADRQFVIVDGVLSEVTAR